ncbi:MAG: J domain-containing protein [Acidobacteriota bacterium]|nr:J domain-containing protein [Acidobacteriota bacterium]
MLSVASTADADTIKKAFRREIARYHPDKVVHLGPEFQEMAATRAAELTVAYKTLSDPVLRAQYDAGAVGFTPPPGAGAEPAPPTPPPPTPEAHVPPPVESDSAGPPPPGKRLFETERAGRDVIVRRAITARVRGIVESLFGAVETPEVRGFDTALVPVAKPRFLGSHPPRVLLKVCELADATAVAEAWNAASRSRVHAGKSPVVVLLCGRQLPPPGALRRALDGTARQRQAPDGPHEMVIVVVNIGDWSCHTQDDLPATVRKLIDRICE